MSPLPKHEKFQFGFEAEYLLANASTLEPLWYDTLQFPTLNECLESIDTKDLPSTAGLRADVPHRKVMPYVVEGYHLPDCGSDATDILPKGIEIRTPICSTIDECVTTFEALFDRMQTALQSMQMIGVAISHHPVAKDFFGPRGTRNHDRWNWVMESMMTYGLDVNVSIPDSIFRTIDPKDFHAKANYYTPAMAAMSVAGPFRHGTLWQEEDFIGKSFRTYRRSIVGPTIRFHPKQNNRVEFKVFEVSNSLFELRSYLLLCLTLLLDPSLKGRASNASRIYALGEAAKHGLDAFDLQSRAMELVESMERILPEWQFNPEGSALLAHRIEQKIVPADNLIALYQQTKSMNSALDSRTQLNGKVQTGADTIQRIAQL